MRGGCKLETRHSLVDYTVEKRFQKAVQDMLSEELDAESKGDGEELDAMMDDLTDFHRDVLDPEKADIDRPKDEGSAQEGDDHDGDPG